MKIQYIAVIFVVIIIPITITMSAYINTQIDTINLQTEYNNKLSNATYSAVKAFQINTINNKYSSVSDSKIRDVEASINTFFNSLGDSEQLTKIDLQDYVPALVYTLYDGYYICSKYDNSYPENNGKPILDSNELNSKDANYGLKTYIYYSCRYVKGSNYDFVVNYTLDNAINIYGKINGEYKTLSGYLINPNSVSVNKYGDNPLQWKLTYDEKIEIKPEILTEHIAFSDGTSGDYEYVSYNGQKIYYDTKNEKKYFVYNNYSKLYLINEEMNQYLAKRTSNGHLYSTSAFEYYYKAKQFSEQVIQLIGNITQKDAVNANNEQIIDFAVDTQTEPIFKVSKTNDPLLSESSFNQNRISVIRKSIETNLSAAISNFKSYSSNTYEFCMPKLKETDWEAIANNVAVMAFLQGIPIGHKYYNNYYVITNNNNEEVVKKENIYIITEDANGNREYHLAGCKQLMQTDYEAKGEKIVQAYSNTSFIRQTVKIAEDSYGYFYPQNIGKNKNITSCYYCIVNATDIYNVDEIIKGKIWYKNIQWEDEIATGTEIRNLEKIRQVYFTALARERYDLYQANMDSFEN